MTYDDHQLGAVLTQCTVCRCMKWMTAPQAICIRCRQQQPPAAAARDTEREG